jgi:outer membrane protein TolC
VSFGNAQTHMFGLRQAIPPPGSLDARSRVALADAQTVRETLRGRAQDVAQQVRKAFATYYQSDREYAVHLEHVALTESIVELARSNYRVGRATQQDVLRTMVALSQLHNDVELIEQQRTSAGALLNALIARSPDAPLGPPATPATQDRELAVAEWQRKLEARRPEIASAERAIQRSEAELDEARAGARWPTFMVGADYWYMPLLADPHAYGAMVAVSLPWLNPGHRERTQKAEAEVEASRRALEGIRNSALYQVRDAASRFEAARNQLAVYERDLLPQAQKSYESAQSAFASGGADALSVLDAMRSYLQVRIERARAIARREMALADLERAAGITGEGRQP